MKKLILTVTVVVLTIVGCTDPYDFKKSKPKGESFRIEFIMNTPYTVAKDVYINRGEESQFYYMSINNKKDHPLSSMYFDTSFKSLEFTSIKANPVKSVKLLLTSKYLKTLESGYYFLEDFEIIEETESYIRYIITD